MNHLIIKDYFKIEWLAKPRLTLEPLRTQDGSVLYASAADPIIQFNLSISCGCCIFFPFSDNVCLSVEQILQ